MFKMEMQSRKAVKCLVFSVFMQLTHLLLKCGSRLVSSQFVSVSMKIKPAKELTLPKTQEEDKSPTISTQS